MSNQSYIIQNLKLTANVAQLVTACKMLSIVDASIDPDVIQFSLEGQDFGPMTQGIALEFDRMTKSYIRSTISQDVTVAAVAGMILRDNRVAPGLGPIPVTIADGDDDALGATTDTKVISSDSPGSLIALTKGLLDKYMDDGEAEPGDNYLMPIAGVNGGTIQSIQTDTAGRLIVAGPTTPGNAPAGSPVQVSGVDVGGNVRRIYTDTTGATVITGHTVEGLAPNGYSVPVAGLDQFGAVASISVSTFGHLTSVVPAQGGSANTTGGTQASANLIAATANQAISAVVQLANPGGRYDIRVRGLVRCTTAGVFTIKVRDTTAGTDMIAIGVAMIAGQILYIRELFDDIPIIGTAGNNMQIVVTTDGTAVGVGSAHVSNGAIS